MADFNDIIDTIATFSNLEKRARKQASYAKGRSIKKMTKDMILQFPLLISQNISVDTACILSGGFEIENTILVRLLLQNDFGTLTGDSGDLLSTLHKIHTNIEGRPTLFQEQQNIIEACKSMSIPIQDKFCSWSLNESTLPKYMRNLNEAISSNSSVVSGGNPAALNNPIAPNGSGGTDSYSDYDKYVEKDANGVERTVEVERRGSSSMSVEFSEKNPFNPDMFKKVNELVPTFVKVKITIANTTSDRVSRSVSQPKQSFKYANGINIKIGDRFAGDNHTYQRTSLDSKEIVFGVKCMAHPIKSEDIIFNIGNEFKNSTMFKFVKWTTGEYSFAKGLGEILFDFTNMKNTGIQAAKTSNYWWYKLRKLRNDNKRVRFSSRYDEAPIKTATLAITKDEVDYISTTYRIDLSMPKFAQKLMDSLYLLNFCYVDEATELVYLYDEPSSSYIIKRIKDFKRNKNSDKPLSIEDIQSLFKR